MHTYRRDTINKKRQGQIDDPATPFENSEELSYKAADLTFANDKEPSFGI